MKMKKCIHGWNQRNEQYALKEQQQHQHYLQQQQQPPQPQQEDNGQKCFIWRMSHVCSTDFERNFSSIVAVLLKINSVTQSPVSCIHVPWHFERVFFHFCCCLLKKVENWRWKVNNNNVKRRCTRWLSDGFSRTLLCMYRCDWYIKLNTKLWRAFMIKLTIGKGMASNFVSFSNSVGCRVEKKSSTQLC